MESSKHPLNWAERRVLAPEKWQEMRPEGSLAHFSQDCLSLEMLAWFANTRTMWVIKKRQRGERKTCSTNHIFENILKQQHFKG